MAFAAAGSPTGPDDWPSGWTWPGPPWPPGWPKNTAASLTPSQFHYAVDTDEQVGATEAARNTAFDNARTTVDAAAIALAAGGDPTAIANWTREVGGPAWEGYVERQVWSWDISAYRADLGALQIQISRAPLGWDRHVYASPTAFYGYDASYAAAHDLYFVLGNGLTTYAELLDQDKIATVDFATLLAADDLETLVTTIDYPISDTFIVGMLTDIDYDYSGLGSTLPPYDDSAINAANPELYVGYQIRLYVQ